jgi:acetylornithine/N-succinyldiaminopimelate aminotransferase
VLTDNPKIIAPSNKRDDAYILPWGNIEEVEKKLLQGNIAGIIIEGIQGVGGIHVPNDAFLKSLSNLSKKYGAKLILDEVQSGYGRTGRFFAHQWVDGLMPDLVTVAKGMGNGFPIGGVLIHPDIKASHGLLGTTFGGNHLACAAGLAVLEILEKEKLISYAEKTGTYLIEELMKIKGVTEVRGKGLMIGIDLDREAGPVRSELVTKYRIFTGSSAGKHTIRLLPPLNIEINQLSSFLDSLKKILN